MFNVHEYPFIKNLKIFYILYVHRIFITFLVVRIIALNSSIKNHRIYDPKQLKLHQHNIKN